MDDRPARSASMAMMVFGSVAVIASAYLTLVDLAGGIPVCGPVKGCETVTTSAYSHVLGVPIALPGTLFAVAILVAAVAWWRLRDRRALYAAYGLGMLGVLVVACLTLVEILVIHAVCAWCATFALSILLGWIASVIALRLTGDDEAG
jgi:uncharacterized membrane protein